MDTANNVGMQEGNKRSRENWTEKNLWSYYFRPNYWVEKYAIKTYKNYIRVWPILNGF